MQSKLQRQKEPSRWDEYRKASTVDTGKAAVFNSYVGGPVRLTCTLALSKEAAYTYQIRPGIQW
jgi:hypothetical protein